MPEGLTKDEFFDVYRSFNPDATREEYEREWNEFQRLKAEHFRQRKVN
jgi:hypothetical protein